MSGHLHAPANPSGLREAHTLSTSPDSPKLDGADKTIEEDFPPLGAPADADKSNVRPGSKKSTSSSRRAGATDGQPEEETDESTWLLAGARIQAGEAARSSLLQLPFEFGRDHIHPGPCNHGTFSPQPVSRPGSIRSITVSYLGRLAPGGSGNGKKLTPTARLAQEHGVEWSKFTYVVIALFAYSMSFCLERYEDLDLWHEYIVR